MREGTTVRGKGKREVQGREECYGGKEYWQSNFSLRGDAEWERDCYMDIMGICVCTCRGRGERRGRNLQEESKKKEPGWKFGHGKARLMLATDNKGRQRGRKRHKIHLKNSPSLKAPQRLCNRKGLLSTIFFACFSFGAVSEGWFIV